VLGRQLAHARLLATQHTRSSPDDGDLGAVPVEVLADLDGDRGSAMLTTVASRKATDEPSTVAARTQRPAGSP